MSRILKIIAVISFLFALGIVGAVEHGAPLARMWLLVPAFAVLAGCVIISEKYC